MKARKILLVNILHIIGSLMGWFSIFLLSRYWGSYAPTALGMLAFGMSFVGLFQMIGNPGISGSHIKRLSEGKDEGECIGAAWIILIATNILMIALILGYLFLMKYAWSLTIYDATKQNIIYIFILYYICVNLSVVPTYTFLGREEVARSRSITFIEPLVRTPLYILVALAGIVGASYAIFSGVTISPTGEWPGTLEGIRSYVADHALGALGMTYVAGAVCMLIFGVFLLRHHPLKRPSGEMLRSYMTFALPTTIVGSVFIIQSNIDKVMIGYFWSAEEVGQYFVAQKLIIMMLVLSSSVGTVIFPAFSRYSTQNREGEIKRVAERSFRFISLISLPVVAFIAAYNADILDIMFSSAFRPAGTAFAYLGLFFLLTSLLLPFRSILMGIDRPGLLAKISVVALGSNIALNLVLVPSSSPLSEQGVHGPTGAAVATAISAGLTLVMSIGACRGYYKNVAVVKPLVLHCLAGIGMYAFLLLLDSAMALTRWYHMIGFGTLGIVMYVGILYIMDEWKDEDFRFFLDAFSVSEMLKYIRSEFRRHKRDGPGQ